MLWRRQPLTRQGPLASSGWRNRARAASGYRPGPATLLTARQVTPLNSHPAALPHTDCSIFQILLHCVDHFPLPQLPNKSNPNQGGSKTAGRPQTVHSKVMHAGA